MAIKCFSCRPVAAICGALALTLLAGCAEQPVATEPRLTYVPPTRQASNSVALDQSTVSDAVSTIAARLKAAGVTVVSADKSRGLVRARSDSTAFVDCGLLTQDFAGNQAEFAGNAPHAILIADQFPAGLVRRSVVVRNDFTIRVDPTSGNAEIGQRHDIAIEMRTADDSRRLWLDREVATGGAPATFSDGVQCVSSGLISQIVGG